MAYDLACTWRMQAEGLPWFIRSTNDAVRDESTFRHKPFHENPSLQAALLVKFTLFKGVYTFWRLQVISNQL